MPHVSYPDSQDIEARIRSLGIFDADALDAAILDLDLETAAAAASREWEVKTGWIPFLADATDKTRRFDPQGPNWKPWIQGGGYPMDLGAGLIALTSLTTDLAPGASGTVLAADTDYLLAPYNAVLEGMPYTRIEFIVRQWGIRQSIQVVGKFGYSATVPDDAWLAIARKGALSVLPEIATNITEGGWTFTEAGVTEKPMDGFLLGEGTVGGAWVKQWEQAVNRYKRLVL